MSKRSTKGLSQLKFSLCPYVESIAEIIDSENCCIALILLLTSAKAAMAIRFLGETDIIN
jgi:hypothetical protein